MRARTLVLEIVTPDGPILAERGVDSVVLRRREARFELGSEIAILPLHAPTLIRIPVAPVRYRRGGRTFHLAVGGGFAEVEQDRVLVVTPRCERPLPGEPDPRARAREICRTWRREHVDSREGLAGYPWVRKSPLGAIATPGRRRAGSGPEDAWATASSARSRRAP